MGETRIFSVGRHFPVYFWAGPSAIRMNRLKFMDAPVNEAAHLDAHTPAGVARLKEAGFNWAYLMCNWGFPPEIEREDWDAFGSAVDACHAAGLRTFGYVQLSNCVYAGSHCQRDWYAQDPRGRRLYYYTGRYMTCWLHPEWRDQLKQQAERVVRAGSDGLFLDNPWMGRQPIHLGGAWLGGAGCYCPRCQEAFCSATGHAAIPRDLDPGDLLTRDYLRWRAGAAWQLVGEVADHARALNPALVVSANDYDAINHNNYVTYGVDLRAAAAVQNVLMIEHFALPRVEADGTPVSGAITCKAARAQAGTTPVTVDPYVRGIGFDNVWPARAFLRGIAESAACGCAMVVKGTEFFDPQRGGFTMITGACGPDEEDGYADQRRAIGRYNTWLAQHLDLYDARSEASPVAVYHPYETLHFDWERSAPLFFGACQTLLAAGIPYRVVGDGAWDGVSALIIPPGGAQGLDARLLDLRARGGSVLPLGESRLDVAPLWPAPAVQRPFWRRNRALQAAVAWGTDMVFRGYFAHRSVRNFVDRQGMTQRFLQNSGLYRLPPVDQQQALLAPLADLPLVRVSTPGPLLADWWQQGERQQLHLVNYGEAPLDEMTVHFPCPVRGTVESPDQERRQSFMGVELAIPLDVYTVLTFQAWEGENT